MRNLGKAQYMTSARLVEKVESAEPSNRFFLESVKDDSAVKVLRLGPYHSVKQAKFLRDFHEVSYKRKFEVVQV